MKKRVLALCMSLVLCISLLPAALAAGKTYAEAVQEFREEDSMREISQTFDSDYGTIFIYGSPNPHGATGSLRFITKAPCAKGEGETIGLPTPRHSIMCATKGPQTAVLSEDGKTLTYVYSFPDELISPYYGTTLHEAGTYTYTVDISTGELSVDHTGVETPLPDQSGKFSDVPAGSWFENGVTTCAQTGVMVGTGEGRFSPSAQLSAAECLTLALRLYDLQRGGDGMMEKAPEDWGKLTLTLNDGTVFQGYGEVYQPFAWSDGEDGGLYVSCEDYGTTLWEEEVWGNAHLGPATVSIGGKDIPGTMRIHMGVSDFLLFFDPDNAGDNELIKSTYYEDAPSPQKWYRDAAYTVKAWGLRDDKHPGFSGLLEWSGSDLDHPADREEFALALYDAAEKLEKKFSVDVIHDVYNGESRFLTREEHGGIFALYEAGILGGINEFGTFGGHEDLTRAEAATMVARILDPGQRLTSAPTPPNAYEQAVAELRNGFTYYAPSERTYETEDCTIFVYDRGGAMHTGPGNITIIYKPGSQPGAGTRIDGERPYPLLTYSQGAKTVRLSEDQKSFIYTYRLDRSAGDPVQEAGIYTYTVDLPTGTITHTYSPFSYEGLTDLLANGRNYTLEQRLEAPSCTVLLRWKPLTWDNDTRDYELWLSYKDPEAQELTQKLLLPSTVYRNSGYAPTDRAPDSLELSGDGRTLTYVYHFDEALSYKDTVYHEAGTYIYTVDLTTGELRVEFLPPYEAAVADIFQLDSFQLDRRLETSQCSIIAGTYQAAHVPRACVALVYKPGSLPGPGTCVFLPTQGGVDTSYSSILPDAMDLSQDGTTLTYTYHFNADGYALDKTYTEHLTQAAGTHTYTVDLTTGEYVYAHTEN